MAMNCMHGSAPAICLAVHIGAAMAAATTPDNGFERRLASKGTCKVRSDALHMLRRPKTETDRKVSQLHFLACICCGFDAVMLRQLLPASRTAVSQHLLTSACSAGPLSSAGPVRSMHVDSC